MRALRLSPLIACAIAMCFAASGAVQADVAVLRVPPAALARGLPLAAGDILREGDDPNKLDAFRLLELETVDAARGAVELTRIRAGTAQKIRLAAGRWDVIVAPLDSERRAPLDLAAALSEAMAKGNTARAAALHMARAQFAAGTRDFDAAARAFAAAAALAPKREDWIAHAQALAFENNPDRTQALRAAERAVELRRGRESGPALLAASLQLLSHWRAQTRDNDGAVEAAREAVRLAPDTLVAANAHVVHSFVAMRTSQHDVAARELEAAQRIVDRIAPEGLDAATLLSRRAVFSAVKREGDAATRLYGQALARLQLLVPDSMLLGRVAFNAHLHALERRRYREAEAQARASMRAFAAASPAGLEFAQARAALAEVLMRRTQYAEAEALLRAATKASDAVGARSYEALSLKLQLGDSLARQSRYADALQIYDAIDAALNADDAPAALAQTSMDADTALYRGEVLSRLDRCADAIEAATRALDRYTRLDRPGTTRWESHLLLSDCRRRRGDLPAALDHARQALAGFSAMAADGIQVALAHLAVARAERDGGRTDAAIAAYRAAIGGLEAHRERVGGSEDVRARWAAQFQDIYKELMWLLARTRQDDAVIETESRYREQALLQLLGDSDADLTPNWAGLAPAGNFRAFELPQDSALVSYVVGAEGTLAIVVLPGAASPKTFMLPATRAKLDDEVDRMLLLGARPSSDPAAIAALQRVGQSLHAALIAPLSPALEPYRRWIVVADGPLLQLPWSALVVNRDAQARYLVEERVLGIVPSAPVWAALAERKPAPRSILAFADPGAAPAASGALRNTPSGRLPGARQEVDALAAAFPGRVRTYLGAAATESQVRRAAPAAGSIHFALHSVTDAREPMASHIVLAAGNTRSPRDDGRLRADEIARELRLHADLVVLSSCASALGSDAGGEGLLGLIRALHLAGTRAVIGTTWPVADRSTARLMRDLYRRRNAGLDSDAALAAAQREWLASARQPAWRSALSRRLGLEDAPPANATHPFYWAGFVHSGAAAR